MNGARPLHHKAAVRRHHLQGVSRLELRGSPVGENTSLDRADADFEHAFFLQSAAGAADGVTAAHIVAVNAGAQGQELAWLEIKAAAQIGWNRQRDGDGACRFGDDACDLEVMKAWGGHGASLRQGSSVRFEVIEGFHAGQTPVKGLARGGAEVRGLCGVGRSALRAVNHFGLGTARSKLHHVGRA